MYNIMEKLDLKDKRILYQLDRDSRQSLTQIGKKVGLPKNVVAYRINKLQKNGIIKSYHTVINAHKLGYIILRFYFTYQYITPEIKKEIIDYFIKSRFSGIVHTIEGKYDLAMYMYIKNLPEFHKFWQKTLTKYRDYFAEQILSFYLEEDLYDFGSLFLENNSNRKKVIVFGGKEPVKIDELDKEILKIIGPNARVPAKDIAEKLGITAITVSNRIKKLKGEGIIQWFKTNIDFAKIGYRWHKVDIVLRDQKRIPQIINYVSQNPRFVCVDKTIGYVDLELEFILKNINELHQIMEDLSLKFPNTIRSYDYVYVVETHKYEYLPTG